MLKKKATDALGLFSRSTVAADGSKPDAAPRAKGAARGATGAADAGLASNDFKPAVLGRVRANSNFFRTMVSRLQ